MNSTLRPSLEELQAILRSPAAFEAVAPLRALIHGWRGDYASAVVLLGQHLQVAEPEHTDAAARALESIFALATPASEALLACAERAPREAPSTLREGPPAWVLRFPRQSKCGPTLTALARTREERALPMLNWVLEQPVLPADIGFLVSEFGPRAQGLRALVARRLSESLRSGDHDARPGLMHALTSLHSPENLEVFLEVATAPTTSFDARHAHRLALGAIGNLGAHAQRAAPVLREFSGSADHALAVPAAVALWRVSGDAQTACSTLERFKTSVGAIEGFGLLGPAASAHQTAIRERLEAFPLTASLAWWRVTGHSDELLLAIEREWGEPLRRHELARVLIELGPLAMPMLSHVEAELSRERRHTASDTTSWSHAVHHDEDLLVVLRSTRAALIALER